MKLSVLFDAFERSVFRLEALDVYNVPSDADRLSQFLAGEAMSPRTVENDSYLQRTARLAASGRSLSRVHAVGRPLTDYVRYELAAYAGNVEAGEQVLIADRDAHADGLVKLDEDFWLFDDRTVALMRYEPDGTFVEVVDASDRLEHFLELRDLAVAAAIPYGQFMENEGNLAR